MEWEFRKILDSFESYKKAYVYKGEIEKGNVSLLQKIVSEIQIILSEPKQKTISKVLALRFARDIMVMGREDVVDSLQKIIPQLLKICSYELESDDPNRGETYFHEHASYLRASDENTRNEIDQLGSTYLILALESVLHWAKWVSVDENNHESIYAKAYTDLLERGVMFPTTFHYYKQSDSQKFRNTYKVEFFTDSYYSSQQSMSNSSSRMVSSKQTRKDPNVAQNLEGSVDSEIFEKTSITTIGQIRDYVEALYTETKSNPASDSTTDKRLHAINRRLQQVYQEEFSSNSLYKNKVKRDEKNWVDKFMVNYGIYASKKCSFRDFIHMVTTDEIMLDENQEESLSVINSNKNIVNGSHVKMYKSPKKELLKATPSPEEILKKQEYEFKSKTYELKCQLEDKAKEIERLKKYHEREKKQIVDDCDRRIEFLKNDLSQKPDREKPLLLELQFENEQLKKKVHLIESELINAHTVKEDELSAERDRLELQVQKLKIENDKLIKIINEKNELEYRNKLENDSNLEKSNQDMFMNTQTAQNFNAKTRRLEEDLDEKILTVKRLEKQNLKYQDEIELYKTELTAERNKKDQKSGALYQKIEYLDSENKALKEKLHETRKTIDVKDVELIDIRQELRRYQNKIKDIHEKKSQWSEAPSVRSERGNFGNVLSPGLSPRNNSGTYQQIISNKKIKFNNYEDLYLELKPSSKETFLRLCRASFKKKDVLFKENELEVGIITEQISGSGNRLKFLLHLTNVAEKQIENIKIESMSVQGSFISTLEYQMELKYIFCIQPQEQEKVGIVVINKDSPYIKDRAILTIQYEKNGIPYSHNVFLPFTIPKFLQNTKPSKAPTNPRYLTEEIVLRYTKKMIPKPSYLRSYFENINEVIEDKKYEVELYNKQTDLNMFVVFGFGENETLTILATMLRERLNERQKYVMEETLGFMEVAFRK